MRKPFLEWLLSLPDYDEITLGEVNEETITYLLPVYENDTEKEALLGQHFDLLFEEELTGWWLAKDNWPKSRSLELFNRWFDVSFHSVVVDLEDAPLLDEE